MKNKKILTGIAGEYFVAGQLSWQGMIAGLTLRNNAGVDIVVSNPEGSNLANIQVKTRRSDKINGWLLGNKPLTIESRWSKTFYVFVSFSSAPENKIVDYYIIPKNTLNREVETLFKIWRRGKKKSGEKRRSNTRIFRLTELPQFEKNKNAWRIILTPKNRKNLKHAYTNIIA